ncbi:uncharacterized protein [Palaemon carinicauda]|uniref:uncharacterized protein n=1 Tax=Palaemon carinicauda TaxID=392227 RepID=UPI0035B61B55
MPTNEFTGFAADQATVSNPPATLPAEQHANLANIKLPPFSHKNVSAWLTRADVQFRIAGLTRETDLANLILSVLPEAVFDRLAQWIESWAGLPSYTEVRAKLIELYSPPIPERARRIFDLLQQPLRDQSPTEAWEELQNLIFFPGRDTDGNRRKIDLEREIFLRRLPPEVRIQLPQPHQLETDNLIRRAQHLFDAARASKLTATNTISKVSAEDFTSDQTCAAITRLNYRNHELTWCFYHKRFGKDARCCVPPCSFPKKRHRRPRKVATTFAPKHMAFYIKDGLSNKRFLVHGVHPLHIDAYKSRKESTNSLFNKPYNGTRIKSYGTKQTKL